MMSSSVPDSVFRAFRPVIGIGPRRRNPRALEVTVIATPPPRREIRWFDRWVASSIPPGSTVLNVGGGCNRSGRLPRVRTRASWIVGLDPSDQIHDNKAMDECHQTSLERYAHSHSGEFDAAFSIFVLEHVANPQEFTRACATVLKPGGVLLGLTVNTWHYFGLTGWAATRLGLSDWLLTNVRTHEAVTAYHFPTEYRMNSIRSLTRLLDRAGFTKVEFRMWDLPRMYQPYLPARLHGLTTGWQSLAYRLDQPRLMGHLTFKATR